MIWHSPNHLPPVPCLLHKGVGGGGGEIFFGGGIFKVSLHSWERGANPLFYEDPPVFCTPLFGILFNTPAPTTPPHPLPPRPRIIRLND